MEGQAEQHLTWWRKNKQLLITVTVVIIVLIVAFALAVYKFGWDWIGFNGGYGQITTTSTSQGTTTAKVKPPGKTLWDLLQLLIVPIVLAVGGFWLNQIQKSREQRTTQQQAELERELTSDNQQENLLQAYIDKMSELLLHEKLREPVFEPVLPSDAWNEAQHIARARTFTVLSKLDARRKRSVIQFLHESDLISKDKCIVHLNATNLDGLNGADLSGADLSGLALAYSDLHRVNLSNANLSQANLCEANLSQAVLSGANLRNAILSLTHIFTYPSQANLSQADLSQADLSGAYLGHVNFRDAILRGTNLSGAVLTDADLTDANLDMANLKGAKVTQEQLAKAKSLNGATMPDGSKRP